ncbi:MoaD/ThiS family protein [Chloroflexota bacterium]
MRIAIAYATPFSEIAHTEREMVTLQGTILADLVGLLAERHGPKFKDVLVDSDTGDVLHGMVILVNGRRSDLMTRLENGDEVAFLMAMAGG